MLNADIGKPTDPIPPRERRDFSDKPPGFADLAVGQAQCAWPETFVVCGEVSSWPSMLLHSSSSQALDHAGRTPSSCSAPFRLDEQHIVLPLDKMSPVNPFNREKGINNPSLVGRSSLIGKSFQGRTVQLNEGFDLCRKGLFHLTSHGNRLRRSLLLLFTSGRFAGFESVGLHGWHDTAIPK
jgi:hypothetical protein